MKFFNVSILKAVRGELSAMLFANDFLKIPLHLDYSINIQLKSFQVDGSKAETSIRLDSIKFDIKSLEDLEGKLLEFPINPVEGYIDGSIYLFDVHNPVDVTKIEFDKFVNNAIDVTIHYKIDFEYEGTPYKNTELNQLKVKLDLHNFRVDKEYWTRGDEKLDSQKLLESFINAENIGEAKEETERQIFAMKVD